jgi:hypothetical protein
MKRVAIQLFGHLRSFKKTFDSFYQNIILPNQNAGYELDVFMHTWDETDHSTITWHNQAGERRGREVTEEIIDFIKKKYTPRKLLIEKQVDAEEFIIKEKILGAPRAYKGVVNVAYTKYMSTRLRREYEKECGISYDYVILTRPDILFHQPFAIDGFLLVYGHYGWPVPENGLFFGYNFFSRGDVEEPRLLGGIDIIFFGRPTAIDKATSFYELVENGTVTTQEVEADFYCFEVFWYRYWISQGLEPIRIKYIQFSSFNIIRNEEEYTNAISGNQQAKNYIHSLKINQANGYDQNFINLRTQTKGKAKPRIKLYLYKILRKLIKIFPYFFAYRVIERLHEIIKVNG